jgi:hypothetical protein
MGFMADDTKIGDSPKSQEIVDDLSTWCDQEAGREALAGKVIGVERETVKNWITGQQQPNSKEMILVREFLAKQENWEKSA